MAVAVAVAVAVAEPADRRAAQRARTRERIFDTAMRLFGERGFDLVSVGQITRVAGVTVPEFYAYFGSKEELVLGVPTAEGLAAVLPLQAEGAGTVAEQIPG